MGKIGIRYAVWLLFLLQTAAAQQSQRLNTGWEFVKGDLGGIWEAVRPVPKGGPEAVPLWDSVTIPHCVNRYDAVDPDVNYYQGPAWYRKRLTIKNPYPGGRTLLHFEGAGQKTEVYIGTAKVAAHTGGYDEWTVDITDAVAGFVETPAFTKQFMGSIPLSVRTDNSRDLQMIPSSLSDFTLYGGLYRYVNLVYQPALSLEKLWLSPAIDSASGRGTLTVKGVFYDPLKTGKAAVRLRLMDPAGKDLKQVYVQVSSTDSPKDLYTFSIPAVQRWSVERPCLYTVEATVIHGSDSSTLKEKTGFRSFAFLPRGPFLLNGKRLLIRGTQRHEDHAGAGAALTEELMREEMIAVKNMGANFIRLGHYQQSRYILQLCDSLGILVWEEIPWCRGGLGGEVYKDQARRMLTNMIGQHYNHASVIIWGLGNENDWPGDFSSFDTLAIRNFMKELNELSHRLDPSRKTAIRRCDFCKDIVDVYSPSIWAGWYRGIYTEYKAVTEEEFKKVDHFLHMEWGGDSHAGRHSESPDKALQKVKAQGAADERAGDASLYGGAARVSRDGDWSESYICNLFDWHLKEQETMPWLTGTAQWVFKDFATPIRPDNPIPYMNQKGVLTRDGKPKESYFVFQSWWAPKLMAHIYGHTMPVRWGEPGEAKMIKVYSNAAEAELFVDGKSQGRKQRNPADFPAAGLRWNVALEQGIHTTMVKAWRGKEMVTDTIHFLYETRKWGKPAEVVLEKVSEQDGIVTLEVKLLDTKGVLCLDAADWLRFGVTGPAQLIDDLGTPDGSRLVQAANGRARIQIKKQGRSVASVLVKGLEPVFLDL